MLPECIFVWDICSVDISISMITWYWFIINEFLVLLSANIGRYCTRFPVSVIPVTPVIPVFGSYLQFENPIYSDYQYISNGPSLILTIKIWDCAPEFDEILASEIVHWKHAHLLCTLDQTKTEQIFYAHITHRSW